MFDDPFSFTGRIQISFKGGFKPGDKIAGRTTFGSGGCPINHVVAGSAWLFFLHGQPDTLTLEWDDVTNVNISSDRGRQYLADIRQFRRVEPVHTNTTRK
jgi:hypothetical protein